MGVYTQIRGWLNVDSISNIPHEYFVNKLKSVQYNFREELSYLKNKCVCEDTIVHFGNNGSVYLFFGTELKNYDSSVDEWIKYLIINFTNAEGRIDYCHEEDDCEEDSLSRYLLIRDGKIIEDSMCKTWTHGYGNFYKRGTK